MSKNILIIGASSSLGESIFNRFDSNLHNIILTCTNKISYKVSENTSVYKLDIGSDESINNFRKTACGFDGIDVCIMLPGVLLGKSLLEYKNTEIDYVISVNLSGFAKLIKNILEYFNSGSQIIIMSSISGERGSYDPIYAASKGGLISMTKSLSTSLAPKTRVNAIAPSLINDTTMSNDMDKHRRSFHLKNTPTKSLLTKGDLSNIVYDITKPHWGHLNGAVLRVNGGQYV